MLASTSSFSSSSPRHLSRGVVGRRGIGIAAGGVDFNASVIVASGLFSTHDGDVGAGTAEYVGVAVPTRVAMILAGVPEEMGGNRTNSFLLTIDDEEEEEEEEEERRDADNEETMTATTSSSSCVFFVPTETTAAAASKDYLLPTAGAPPKSMKAGSSVPARRFASPASLHLPGAHSVVGGGGFGFPGSDRGAGISAASVAARSFVSASFGGSRSTTTTKNDTGYLGVVGTAKSRGDRLDRRSSTDADDALGTERVRQGEWQDEKFGWPWLSQLGLI